MNYYPPCVKANEVIGIAPHSDATGLTVLLQVNEVQGLQIRKAGKWLPIKPIPGAFIINIGDIITVIVWELNKMTIFGKSSKIIK